MFLSVLRREPPSYVRSLHDVIRKIGNGLWSLNVEPSGVKRFERSKAIERLERLERTDPRNERSEAVERLERLELVPAWVSDVPNVAG